MMRRPEYVAEMMRRPGTVGRDDAEFDLSNYEMRQEIGKGPFGVTYEAVDMRTGQPMAMKILMSRVPVDKYDRERFFEDVWRIATIPHPHLVQFHACGGKQSTFCFVTELCDGGNLEGGTREYGGKLPLTEVRSLMHQCLTVLHYLHGLGIVHRNLKPQNILLIRQQGRLTAKISDLGLANQFELAGFAGMTLTCKQGVNYQFTPREVLTGYTEALPASDLWSLAACFYYAATGTFPMDLADRDPIEVILQGEPVSMRLRDPSIPEPVAGVIDRALSADVNQRYGTAAEMLRDWELAFAGRATLR